MGGRGEVGARGWAGVGEGPAQPPHRLSAPSSPRPLPPGRPPPLQPSPSTSQGGDTALDIAKANDRTGPACSEFMARVNSEQVVRLLEKYTPAYFAAQVGHPATRRAAPSLVHNPPRLIAVPRERYLGAYLLLSTHTAHHSLRIQANSNPEGAGRL